MRNLAPLTLTLVLTASVSARQDDTLRWWPPDERPVQTAYEKVLLELPAPDSLRAYHTLFGSEPHVAGTPGDLRNIDRMVKAFEELGLDVQVHEFWAYLSYPEDAAVEIIGAGDDGGNLSLSLQEADLEQDPFDEHPDLTFGWNAYSASGDITGEVVYANYGTKEDFQKLDELGIDLNGKIVIARYGGNFRGYKAKFAQHYGAAGLIMYTDPKDSGFVKGEVYPDGVWANDSYIQRGSIKALNYEGDPLTPFLPATEDTWRVDVQEVGLPRIPVQPMSYGAAKEILARFNGQTLPEEWSEQWQGGLPFEYRLTGGDLRVRLMVKQKREIKRSANVVAILKGSLYPDEKIYIGCHHDAWGFGAGDPLAGTMLVFEAAKSFTQAAKKGFTPLRSIVFANWGAEEYGIIGSTEYVEQFSEALLKEAIVYINLDAATMGPNFHSSASPSLKQVIDDVTRLVPQARMDDQPVHEAWLGDRSEPNFGNLGGGSDHVGFYCHLCIPSCSLGAGGAEGTAYHSNYDTLTWYRKAIGEDYEPALMLARVVNLLSVRLANAPVLPLDPVRYAIDGREHLEALTARAEELDLDIELQSFQEWLVELEKKATSIRIRLYQAIQFNSLSEKRMARINEALQGMEKCWMSEDGLPDRSWFRNLYASTDPYSGYAAWMFPAIRLGIESRDVQLVHDQVDDYLRAIRKLGSQLDLIDEAIPQRAQ